MGPKEQKNFRIDGDLRYTLERVSDLTGINETQIIEDGLRWVFGITDYGLPFRRDTIWRALTSLGGNVKVPNQEAFSMQLDPKLCDPSKAAEKLLAGDLDISSATPFFEDYSKDAVKAQQSPKALKQRSKKDKPR